MSALHHKITRRIYRSKRDGHSPKEVRLKPESLDELADWCSAAVWPPLSHDGARLAIANGHLRILEVLIRIKGGPG